MQHARLLAILQDAESPQRGNDVVGLPTNRIIRRCGCVILLLPRLHGFLVVMEGFLVATSNAALEVAWFLMSTDSTVLSVHIYA